MVHTYLYKKYYLHVASMTYKHSKILISKGNLQKLRLAELTKYKLLKQFSFLINILKRNDYVINLTFHLRFK